MTGHRRREVWLVLRPMTTPVQPYEVLTYVDADGDRPFATWLSTVPPGMKGRFLAVIDSVAKAPPHRFSGGGRMGGDARRDGWMARGAAARRANALPGLLSPGLDDEPGSALLGCRHRDDQAKRHNVQG